MRSISLLDAKLTQTCRKCGETRPLQEFDLRADTGKHRTECKACRRAYQRDPLDPSRTRTIWLVGTTDLLQCRTCRLFKPWTEFPRRSASSHRLQTWCKQCFGAYKAERHQRNHDREMRRIRRNHDARVAANRALVGAYLADHSCVDCGETDRAVLDFDHVRDVKVSDVSQMVSWGYPWRLIEAEIAKCDVRCANCHRRITEQRRKKSRELAESPAIYGVGDPGAIRTRGQHLRRVLLYPLSYGVHESAEVSTST